MSGRTWERVRRRAPVGVCLLALALAGCGEGGPTPDVQAPDPQTEAAPVGSATEVAAAPAVDLGGPAEVRQAGLERLDLPLPSDDTSADRLRSRGPAAPAIRESERAIPRESPRALLGGTLDAFADGDVAALARLSRSPATHPTLDVDDAAEAERRFLGPQTRPYWERISAAVRAGAFAVEHQDERTARIRVDVGGAAGAYVIELTKEGDAWYLSG